MGKESDIEFELHAYVDGDLDEDAMARVEAYLRSNPEVAAKVRDYLKQKDDLRGYAGSDRRLKESPTIQRLTRRLARRLAPGPRIPWRSAVVATAAVSAGWIGHMLYQPLVDGPPFTSEILQAHLLTADDPSDVLPFSPERVARLYSRIGEMERLPDLRRFGYEPVGAQLLPSDEGAVLHVPYRNAQGLTVSYFLLHDAEDEMIPRHILHRDGVTMIYWQDHYSRHAFAAPLEDEELSQLAGFLNGSATTR